jgi:hypothetical protein
LLLFLQKKKILFFSEEKNQKTFMSTSRGRIPDLAGIGTLWRRKEGRRRG